MFFPAAQANHTPDEKLFSFDVTRATFLSRNTGFEGKLAERLEEITHDSEQIKFRWAAFLGRLSSCRC
jgi:hypothetical protein